MKRGDPWVRDRHREYMREWMRNHRAGKPTRIRVTRTAEQIALQKRAWHILEHAIKTNLLTRSTFCQVCWTTGKVQGHHEDHTRPLEVVWLCHRCHQRTRRVRLQNP